MKAVCVTPGKKNSAQIMDVPIPDIKDDEVLVRSIRAGICGTDREIHQGDYGTPPKGRDYLILGHESLGVVEKTGPLSQGLAKGDLVVRAVRRPCGCKNCMGGLNDMCPTGKFTESGIKELQGCMAEYFADTPQYLFKLQKDQEGYGVLVEPQSVVEKVWDQACKIQRRLEWEPHKAIVVGAGPIGLLQAMLLRDAGLEVYVIARSPAGNIKSKIVEAIGGQYISTQEICLEDIPRMTGLADIVVEASGDSGMAFESLGWCANNGVVGLTSITGGGKRISIPSDRINFDHVLGNKVTFGSVNANRDDYLRGIKNLERFQNRWPDALCSIFTRRYGLKDALQAMLSDSKDIKTTIEISDL